MTPQPGATVPTAPAPAAPAQATPPAAASAPAPAAVTVGGVTPDSKHPMFEGACKLFLLKDEIEKIDGLKKNDEEKLKAKGEKLKEKCVSIVGDLEKALTKLAEEDPVKAFLLQEQLEAPLPELGDIDFTKQESVNKAVNDALENLGVTKDKLEKMGEEVSKAAKEFVKMKIILGHQKKLKLLSKDKKKREKTTTMLAHDIELLAAEEKIADSPTFENVVIGKQLTDEQVKKIKGKDDKNKLYPDLNIYSYHDKYGKPFIAILGLGDKPEKTFEKVVETLKSSKTITWHNCPEDRQRQAEIATLRAGKKCSFASDGKAAQETPLSKAMQKARSPEGLINWATWFSKIKDETPQPKDTLIKTLEERLVQEVVGDDPERLMEFWRDIHKSPGGVSEAERSQAIGLLTLKQLATLGKTYTATVAELKTLNEKHPQPDDETKKAIEERLRETEERLREVNGAFEVKYNGVIEELEKAKKEEKKETTTDKTGEEKGKTSPDKKKVAKYEAELEEVQKYHEQVKQQKPAEPAAAATPASPAL